MPMGSLIGAFLERLRNNKSYCGEVRACYVVNFKIDGKAKMCRSIILQCICIEWFVQETIIREKIITTYI